MSPPSDRRALWEDRWRARNGPDFDWYLSEPPPELVALLEEGAVPPGAALDLGCGDGVSTACLAEHLGPAIGIDIALEAVRRASERGDGARFLVAEVPLLPIREGAISFVFDRGCLQQIPKRMWPRYFDEVDRVLRPGGSFQLYVTKRDPSAGSPARRLVRRLRAAVPRRSGHPPVSTELIRRMAPAGWDILDEGETRFRGRGALRRVTVYALARKRDERA